MGAKSFEHEHQPQRDRIWDIRPLRSDQHPQREPEREPNSLRAYCWIWQHEQKLTLVQEVGRVLRHLRTRKGPSVQLIRHGFNIEPFVISW